MNTMHLSFLFLNWILGSVHVLIWMSSFCIYRFVLSLFYLAYRKQFSLIP